MTSKYWVLVGLNSFGKCQTKEMTDNKAFFQQQFLEFVEAEDAAHRNIQRQLMHWFQFDDTRRHMAEACLRCFISNQIKELCLGLEQKFGEKHDFTSADLFPMVLDAFPRSLRQASSRTPVRNESLTTRILKTFDPEKSNLSTWTSRMLKSDRFVKQFLLECGIEQVTNWMILNYATPGRLKRVLASFERTHTEIEQALQLLDSYHQVYRTQLLEKRKDGSRARYPDPTVEQLNEMAQKLSDSRRISAEQVLEKLQELASLLRTARIPGKVTFPPPVEASEDNDALDFLGQYRPQFEACLACSVKQVIQARFTYLQSKKTEKTLKKAQNYLKALHLFHCQGVPMKEIASLLGFTDQPHLSRLLDLKTLRSDIGRATLPCLQKYILELFSHKLNSEQLKILNSKIQEALVENIEAVIKEAEKEASAGQNRVIKSQLAQKICQYLKTREEIQ
ncbi:hypothetical protein F7734_02075 [Scytonema sp. UIC 10036]|uniref:hypothetical protein n=1 Tax=Scytonema sp. UIC 10036 TaxID=2304196 RepID=UPI0012DABA18|nr:hypothetical protein [Scytonema sp. UIC 10036]MUG91338.1 hypothetical protein [Scytonema sp. UIC 10036]